MTLTADQFRADFPEFSDTEVFPDATLQLWLAVASAFVNEERWGDDLAKIGLELAAAHYLVFAAREQAKAAAGAIPGEIKGLQTSKSVGDVSASYDVSSFLAEGGGDWNQTTYGVKYLRLARLFGAGGIQL